MDLLRDLITLTDPDQLMQLEVDGLLNFPMYLLWKDRNGKYLGCNKTLANLCGHSKERDMLGATDFDLCWAESANIYRANDQKVIVENKPQLLIESGKIYDGSVAKAISYKLPLRSRTNKIMGVIGVCMRIDEAGPLNNNLINAELNFETIFTTDLPDRQKECVYHLARGMTIKEIADKMQISPRTVGHYLERVKRKLQCNSRSQLISKILSLSD